VTAEPATTANVPKQPTPRAAEPRPGANADTDARSRRELWLWALRQARPYLGWGLAALGAFALFLGWYGVSGEALTAKQIPYLVSGGLTGVALVVLASAFLATEDVRRQLARVEEVERKVDALYRLFVAELEPGAAATVSRPAGDLPVALPSGTSFHRPDCSLVAGKTGAQPVGARDVADRGLRPCRVCEPSTPA
jgi:hypothetical protein